MCGVSCVVFCVCVWVFWGIIEYTYLGNSRRRKGVEGFNRKVGAGPHEVHESAAEEHNNILRSYQAKKHRRGDGMRAIAGQRTDFGLGPV